MLSLWCLLRDRDLTTGGTHGTGGEKDTAQPHHHCRFSERNDLLSAPWRRQGLCRMCDGLSPLPGLSARPQGHVSRRWVSPPPPPLFPSPGGGGSPLAGTMYD